MPAAKDFENLRELAKVEGLTTPSALQQRQTPDAIREIMSTTREVRYENTRREMKRAA